MTVVVHSYDVFEGFNLAFDYELFVLNFFEFFIFVLLLFKYDMVKNQTSFDDLVFGVDNDLLTGDQSKKKNKYKKKSFVVNNK